MGTWDEQMRRRRLGRRTFVRGLAGAGAAAGIVSLAGCASPAPATPSPAAAAAATNPPSSGGAAAPTAAATTAPAKLGGTFRLPTISDTADMDPHANV